MINFSDHFLFSIFVCALKYVNMTRKNVGKMKNQIGRSVHGPPLSYSCPKFQCFYIFKNLSVDYFRYKLLSVWSYLYYPFKWPRQEAKAKQQQNKTKFTATRGQECSPTNRRQPTKLFFCALSQGLCADWLVCIAYCIFWHLIGSDQLSYFS